MLAKVWKKIGIILLIIFCLINIVAKLMSIKSFSSAIEDAKKYIQSIRNSEENVENK